MQPGAWTRLACTLTFQRVHTAIVLLSNLPAATLASSYLDTPAKVVRPAIGEPPRSWVAHSLPRSLGQHLLPAHLAHDVHPLLRSPRPAHPITASPTPYQSPLRLLGQYISGAELDGEWDADDPWPWFALAHVHWPWLLLRSLAQDRGWSRLNVRVAYGLALGAALAEWWPTPLFARMADARGADSVLYLCSPLQVSTSRIFTL